MGPAPKPISERFWPKVARGKDDECWLWQGQLHHGYGRLRVGSAADGTRGHIFAHRLALLLTGVEVPSGKVVMHLCDVPHCCNPAHLRVAMQADNVRDASEKGRLKGVHDHRGERNPNYRHGGYCK